MKILGLAVGQAAQTTVARLVLLLAILLDLALCGALAGTHTLQVSSLVEGHLTHGVLVGARVQMVVILLRINEEMVLIE